MASLIRSTALWGYDDLVRELGGDPQSFFARFGMPDGVERQEDAFVAYEPFMRLLEACANDLNCPDFGLRLSQRQSLDILGPIAVIARNAHTVLEGWDAIARYLYAHSPALTLTRAPQSADHTVTFTYVVTEPGLVVVQGYELSMGVAAQITRLLGGPKARSSVIAFRHDQQGSDASYQQALGCPVRFRQSWCGFELSAGLADKNIDGADPEASRIAAKYLELKYLPPSASLSSQVTDLTHRLLPTGECSLEAIASELAMHPRTLQRRLAAEGTRSQDVIDRERRAQAERYLAQPGLQFSQIAGLLGYAEQSALNRACRRWFGKTPRQVRAEVASN